MAPSLYPSSQCKGFPHYNYNYCHQPLPTLPCPELFARKPQRNFSLAGAESWDSQKLNFAEALESFSGPPQNLGPGPARSVMFPQEESIR